MKKFLVPALVGLALFVGTIVATLAAQGRLNYEGTRGIPVLSGFFAPAKELDEVGSGNGARKASTAEDASPMQQAGIQTPGLGRETEALPRRRDSLDPSKGDPPPTSSASLDGAALPQENQTQGAGQDPMQGRDPQAEQWARQREDLMGQGQYRRGRYFEFPTVESGLSAEQINQMLSEAREQKRLAAQERAELQKRKSDLDARELDIQDRYQQVLEKLQEIDRERSKLEAEIKEAQGLVTMIRNSEQPRLRASARDLEALDPKSAAGLITKWWETPEQQSLALRILTVMSEDARTNILKALPSQQLRDVVEKRYRVFLEPRAATPGR